MGFEDEIEDAILEELAETWIKSEFVKEVNERLDKMIGVGDQDHTGLDKVSESLSDKSEVHIEPLDDFTIVRRGAYKALGQDLEPHHQNLKNSLLKSTGFRQKRLGKKIEITIDNNSSLMEDYMSGRAPSFKEKSRDELLAMAFSMKAVSKALAEEDRSTPLYQFTEYLLGLAGVDNYIEKSVDLNKNIPIRDFLRAAVQNLSKDDLVEFYKNAALK